MIVTAKLHFLPIRISKDPASNPKAARIKAKMNSPQMLGKLASIICIGFR
jgi:hypothetical protein